MPLRLGIDRLLLEPNLAAPLKGRRVAVLGHPASQTSYQHHTLDALADDPRIQLTAAFGPQHGMRGDKQDNMVETGDEFDEKLGIPVFSLYGEVRRPTAAMLDTFDVLLIDLQDIGTRIYTFLTTLLYLLEAGAAHDKAIWVLDRPNPAGRHIEGTRLLPGYESFVGAGPLPMRHGLTLGEAARWFVHHFDLDLDLQVIEMTDYDPRVGPGYGWPSDELPWINPSPNAASVNMTRCFPGTVLLEGTTLSEGRGTTIPLEVYGAPDLDRDGILDVMQAQYGDWLGGAFLRSAAWEPTFHKHQGQLCLGIQVHTDMPKYDPDRFSPYRLANAFLRAVRVVHPDYDLWRDHPYEYTDGLLPIDVIDGGPLLREWVDGEGDLAAREAALATDEASWREEREPFLLYPG